MRIAVMGAGGTGGFFGGLLARAGHEVTFIARGAHLDAIRSRGLTVKSKLAGNFSVRPNATAATAAIGVVDVILFCVKLYDLEPAASLIRPLVGPSTLILPLQNGVEAPGRLAAMFGRAGVLGGVAQVNSIIESPGVIVQAAGPGTLVFGALDGGTNPRVEALLGVLEKAGINARATRVIDVALWEKMVLICGFSGLTALTRLPIGTVMACAESAALLRGTLEEVAVVGRACSVDLPTRAADDAYGMLASVESSARGSLAHDLSAGRRLEIDWLNGAVVRLGHECRVPTPFNFAIYAALKPYAEGIPGPAS